VPGQLHAPDAGAEALAEDGLQVLGLDLDLLLAGARLLGVTRLAGRSAEVASMAARCRPGSTRRRAASAPAAISSRRAAQGGTVCASLAATPRLRPGSAPVSATILRPLPIRLA
jgi:hypothetical protein